MRGVIILAAVIVVVGAVLHTVYLDVLYRDEGPDVLVAFGVPAKETIQMHVGIRSGMLRQDPPRMARKGKKLLREWIGEHFVLRDKSGERVQMGRLGTSAMINESRASSAVEFSLTADLKKGEEYTLDYIRVLSTVKPKRYRYAFTAPSEAEAVWHKRFPPVEEEDE